MKSAVIIQHHFTYVTIQSRELESKSRSPYIDIVHSGGKLGPSDHLAGLPSLSFYDYSPRTVVDYGFVTAHFRGSPRLTARTLPYVNDWRLKKKKMRPLWSI